MTSKIATVMTLGSLMFLGQNACGDAIIVFSNGDTFDGDTAGDMAGPFLDPSTNVNFGFLTNAIGGGGTALNSNSGTLGIVGGANTGSFDPNESWTFSLNSDINLTGIDFGSFTAAETFTLQSNAWALATFDAPNAEVAFVSTATEGTFTFSAGSVSDSFGTSDFTSAGNVFLGSGNNLTLTYTGAGNAVLQGLTINAVPEPSGLFIVFVGILAINRRNRKP